MGTELIPVNEVQIMAAAVAKSGLFGVKSHEQALALMLVSQAEGRHPALAARDYDVIQGRPAKKAEAMLRDFFAGGGKVEWHQLDDTIADATFSHAQGGSVRIVWDMPRAKKAGLGGKDMWSKYPRQMLRSRTVSEGVRTVWPAATSGMYVPEEVQDFAPAKARQVSESPPMLAAPITPTTGAMESLPEDRIEIVQRIGQAVVEMFQAGAIEDAYTYLYVENKDAGRIDNDEFVAIWSMLQSYSKERKALKKLRDEAMTVQATTPEPADA
jgi:hypothetical protein